MGKIRSTKWYRENESEVMEKLGLKPTKNSGAGWVEKEDGQNDYLICQLKSTDMGSISVKKKDLELLEYNASVSHKIPVFALQYIGDTVDDVWLMVKPVDLVEVSKYIKTGCCKKVTTPFDYEGYNFDSDGENKIKVTKIKSGRTARDQYEKKRLESFQNRKRIR